MGNYRGVRPVPPGNHPNWCRCPGCRADLARSGMGGWGIVVPFFIAAIIFAWPFAVWHGCKYGGGSGLSGCGASSEWVWNTDTWIAQGIWWALLVPSVAAIALGTYRRKYPRAVRPSPATHFPDGEPLPPAPPPRGPDPAVTAALLRDLEAADAIAGLAEKARSAEELDYLRIHEKLPDGWPFRGREGK